MLSLPNWLASQETKRDLELYYQLQFNLLTGEAVSAEALLRNGHSSNTAPLGILLEAEQDGSIGDITTWAIDKALEDFRALRMRHGIAHVAVNASPSDIMQNDLVKRVEWLLKKHKLQGKHLELEITERLPLVHLRNAVSNIIALNALGVRVVLDDFGTGYTSLPMLVNLPIQGIKLDRTFCINLGCAKHRAITESLVTLTSKLKMSVMIEGIETLQQQEQVLAMGCTIGQGFLLHRPQSKHKLLLRR